MAKTATKKEATVESKLDALFELQLIDSEIDRIQTVRGELPLRCKIWKMSCKDWKQEFKTSKQTSKKLKLKFSDRKNAVKDAELAISKYKEQQNNVRNNREFESLAKEIEFQELEIKLHDKKSKEAKVRIDAKKEILVEAQDRFKFRQEDMTTKRGELEEIIAETQKDEEKLTKDSNKAKKKIDERLITAYERLRGNSKNGLAVVSVERDSCGGCFNKIPPQRQLDIATKRKVIVCEHCGRILVPQEVEVEEEK